MHVDDRRRERELVAVDPLLLPVEHRQEGRPRRGSGSPESASQAASLTVISVIPGGPPRHFCAAATAMSICQSSVRNSMPPTDETQSTMVSTPRLCAMGPIAATSWSVPDGVSEWTTVEHLDLRMLVQVPLDVCRIDRVVVGHLELVQLGSEVLQPVAHALAEHAGHEVEHRRSRVDETASRRPRARAPPRPA